MRVIPGVLNSKIQVPRHSVPSLRACLSWSASKLHSSKLLPAKTVGVYLGAEFRFLKHRPVYDILRDFAPQDRQHGGDGRFAHHAKTLVSPADRVRGEDHVIKIH